MGKNEKNWYKLDAFAKTYSSIISEGRTTCFRLSVLFSENVDLEILQEILPFMEKKYPFFNSELKRGIFWNYLQEKNTGFTVEKEKTYPCTDIQKNNPLRIIYYNNKLSVEIAHFLTDGGGAMIFFKDLLERYLEEKYFIVKNKMKMFAREKKNLEDVQNVEKDEYVNSYEKYLRKVSKEVTIKSAFHLPLKILKKGQYHITTGEISLGEIKKESKKHKTTIGKYLLAVYFKILLDRYFNAKNPIVIGVPVDLRKIFVEKTYRNFFINITPSVDASLGTYSLSEIITYLDNYFALKINEKEFYKSIYKAMNPVENILIQIVPYFIKRMFFPFIFDYYGERGYTTGFSNLGIFRIDEKYQKYVLGFRFLPPPSKRCKVKIGVISDTQKIYINFGNLTTNYEIERDFFVYLRKRGIRSKIITNY
ncbi:alcohol acetyltransferase [Leptotrichia sp. oral taxon 847]|uniref:alcohol acetyltransferase n=1 Tax=Leptotrichia sp. oral taxon 847 TaxID=1785996 RepID=UPI00076811C0|nr:alcohol acetyltransferase [Leptotrichia sp. oral taxon 847]AMD95430.1 alcohol acetyltransferase [Leptotrichia sp. oral taxon 847]